MPWVAVLLFLVLVLLLMGRARYYAQPLSERDVLILIIVALFVLALYYSGVLGGLVRRG